MSSTHVPNPNDLGRGPMIMGILWPCMAIATFVVAARLRVRAKTHSLYWDDWLMLAALVRLIG
jgi:hypothetical protein